MAKKLSVTEIDTLTDYVSGIIVKEQREKASLAKTNCTEKQFNHTKAEIQKQIDAYNKMGEELAKTAEVLKNNPVYYGGKRLSLYCYYTREAELDVRKIGDDELFPEEMKSVGYYSFDYESYIKSQVRTKIVLRNIGGTADIDAIIEEMRASLN